jgi:hypothetical protein
LQSNRYSNDRTDSGHRLWTSPVHSNVGLADGHTGSIHRNSRATSSCIHSTHGNTCAAYGHAGSTFGHTHAADGDCHANTPPANKHTNITH